MYYLPLTLHMPNHYRLYNIQYYLYTDIKIVYHLDHGQLYIFSFIPKLYVAINGNPYSSYFSIFPTIFPFGIDGNKCKNWLNPKILLKTFLKIWHLQKLLKNYELQYFCINTLITIFSLYLLIIPYYYSH